MKDIFYEPGKLNSNCSYCCKGKPIEFEEGNENLYALGNLCKISLLAFCPKLESVQFCLWNQKEDRYQHSSIPQLCAAHITEVQSDHHLS